MTVVLEILTVASMVLGFIGFVGMIYPKWFNKRLKPDQKPFTRKKGLIAWIFFTICGAILSGQLPDSSPAPVKEIAAPVVATEVKATDAEAKAKEEADAKTKAEFDKQQKEIEQKNKENAEAAAKAKEEQAKVNANKFDKGNFTVISSKMSNEDGIQYIAGSVKNNTSKEFSYVQVEINLYDDSGAQVGSTLANANNLEANGTWNFKAIILEDNAKSYKIKNISSF